MTSSFRFGDARNSTKLVEFTLNRYTERRFVTQLRDPDRHRAGWAGTVGWSAEGTQMASRVQGGKRWARFLKASKRAKGKAPVVDVGFLDPHVGRLAARLEFGDPRSNLPERPAFRQGIGDLKRTMSGVVRDAVAKDWKRGIVVTKEEAAEVGVAARDIIKVSYMSFDGPGLSERQEARKRGTPGAGKELIGSEGPKLVERIEARVDGKVTT